MASRSGGASVALVGQLQEARKSLEMSLKLPVASSIGKDLRLLVAVKDDEDAKRVPAKWQGFPVEVRKPAVALAKGKGAPKK
jgi:hypothetical protein